MRRGGQHRNLRGIVDAWKRVAAFQRASRALKRESRAARREWFEEHIQAAEQAARAHNLGAVYMGH